MVSIITVNYNGLDDTYEMIDSFLLNETYPFKIIVVDNGSQPSQAEKFGQHYAINPQVKVVQNVNNGFVGGGNAGSNVTSGDYLFFVNDDTYITQPIFEVLVYRLGDKQSGGVPPMLKYHQCTNTIQFAGFTPLTPITLRNHMIGEREPDNGQHSTPHETAYLYGTAMMIHRDILQRVGPMSEVFFLFYEKMDWSVRIRRAGYRLWYEPVSVIYRKRSMTAQRNTPLRRFYMSRARMLFVRRNLSGINQALSCPYIGLIATPKKAITRLLHGRISLTMAVLKGVMHGMATRLH